MPKIIKEVLLINWDIIKFAGVKTYLIAIILTVVALLLDIFIWNSGHSFSLYPIIFTIVWATVLPFMFTIFLATPGYLQKLELSKDALENGQG